MIFLESVFVSLIFVLDIYAQFSEKLFLIEFIQIRVTDVTTTYLIISNKDCTLWKSALIHKTKIAGSCLLTLN